MEEKQLFEMSEEEFNEACPPGSTVCLYPVFFNSKPNPRYRKKTQTLGKAINKGSGPIGRKSSRALAVHVDGRESMVSVGQLRLCRRVWYRVNHPGTLNRWQMEELDELELDELRERLEADSGGYSFEIRYTMPSSERLLVDRLLTPGDVA